MATITIQNIPDDLFEQIKRSADINRRSVNNEIILCLEQNFGMRTEDVQEILARAQQLREKTSHFYLTDETLMRAKTEGRP